MEYRQRKNGTRCIVRLSLSVVLDQIGPTLEQSRITSHKLVHNHVDDSDTYQWPSEPSLLREQRPFKIAVLEKEFPHINPKESEYDIPINL